MSGMNRYTGKLIVRDKDHVRQSIQDILETPIGTRAMRRDYGSRLFYLVSAPITNEIDVYAAVAESLDKWEPRFELTEVKIKSDPKTRGRVEIEVNGNYLPSQQRLTVGVKL
jgi:phage baseplate assembly protein W